jgi:hypothetical protein
MRKRIIVMTNNLTDPIIGYWCVKGHSSKNRQSQLICPWQENEKQHPFSQSFNPVIGYTDSGQTENGETDKHCFEMDCRICIEFHRLDIA